MRDLLRSIGVGVESAANHFAAQDSKRTVHTVVHRFCIRPTDCSRHDRSRQFIYYEELNGQALVRRKCSHRCIEPPGRLGEDQCVVRMKLGFSNRLRRSGKVPCDCFSAEMFKDFKSRGYLSHERTEGEDRARLLGYELVGFDVRSALTDDSVKDLLLNGGEPRRRHNPPSAVTMPDPVDRLMVNDSYEPRREPGSARIRMTCENGQVIPAKVGANLCEYVGGIIVIRKVAPDYSLDQPSVARNEQAPRRFGVTRCKSCAPNLRG